MTSHVGWVLSSSCAGTAQHRPWKPRPREIASLPVADVCTQVPLMMRHGMTATHKGARFTSGQGSRIGRPRGPGYRSRSGRRGRGENRFGPATLHVNAPAAYPCQDGFPRTPALQAPTRVSSAIISSRRSRSGTSGVSLTMRTWQMMGARSSKTRELSGRTTSELTRTSCGKPWDTMPK